MISFTAIAMIGWIPVILLLFAVLRPRRAVIVAYIVGWMFLPVISWDLPGLPAYDKLTATNFGVLGAILLFDARALLRLRPSVADLPVLVLCLCPIGSSLTNDLGLYDGIAGAWRQIVTWSVPWIVGRIYLGSLEALRDLAVGLLVASTIYVPLCLYEMLFGANLHLKLYNYYQHGVVQTIRTDGSIRPMVFMQHGLVLSMWLATSSLAGLAVAWNKAASSLSLRSRRVMAAVVILTCLLSRSLGATVLMVLGITLWSVARSFRWSLPVVALVAAIPLYMTLRATNLLTSSELSSITEQSLELAGVSRDETAARLQSATTRFVAEDLLCAEVQQSPIFGVSSWTFHQYIDRTTGELRTMILDGRWAILFATRGFVGLAAWTAMILLPILLFILRYPASTWRNPLVCISGALSVALLLHGFDSLLNADPTPIYPCIAGGLVSVAIAGATQRQKPARARRPRLEASLPAGGA